MPAQKYICGTCCGNRYHQQTLKAQT